MQIPAISGAAFRQLLLITLLTITLIWNFQPSPKSIPTFSDDCQLSLAESDNFICESNAVWNERKNGFHIQDKENMMKRKTFFFFLDNWERNFHCSNTRRLGMCEGGKWVCDLYRLKSRHNCLVYSAGSNGEFTFEIEMKKAMPHCEIHTFDKDLHSCPNNSCIFHKIKLGDGINSAYSKNWTTIVHELNHTNRLIDILKIDIEGDEYSFFPLIFNSAKSSFPRQILVEVHPSDRNGIHAFFERLRSNNYVIFSKEQNLLAGQHFFEYGFLKLNPRFFIQSS